MRTEHTMQFEKSFILKQQMQSVICVHGDELGEEMIRLLGMHITTIKAAFVYREQDGETEVHMLTQRNLEPLLQAFSDTESVSSTLEQIRRLALHLDFEIQGQFCFDLEGGGLPLFQYFSNYYETQNMEIHFYIFQVPQHEIPDLQRTLTSWYMQDINAYFDKLEGAIAPITSANLPTPFGQYTLSIFLNKYTNEHHIALILGDVDPDTEVLVRIHSECLTGDCFYSLKCDCGEQLQRAFQEIENAGGGIILYLRQEGRGIGLINKIRAYNLQDGGADTVDANTRLGLPEDMRDYSFANAILKYLKVKNVRLLTNNPSKIHALDAEWFNSITRRSIEIPPNTFNRSYLITKKLRMDHMILNEDIVAYEV